VSLLIRCAAPLLYFSSYRSSRVSEISDLSVVVVESGGCHDPSQPVTLRHSCDASSDPFNEYLIGPMYTLFRIALPNLSVQCYQLNVGSCEYVPTFN